MRFTRFAGFCALLYWLLVPSVWAMKAAEVAACRPNMPQTVRTLKGLFHVHIACDHVLFEIPLDKLNKDMLINTEFAALSTGSDFVAPGSVVDSRVVRWVRRGNKVYLENVRYEMWAPNMANLQRGVEQASLRTVIKAFDAVSEGADGAPIIDVTGLFATDVPDGFGREFKQHFRMNGIDPKRSYIENVKAFPQNIEVRFYQTWVPDVKELNKPTPEDQDPIPPALGFVFHTSMLLLPDEPMKGRYADPRVGYFAESFDDYGTSEHSKVRRAFITRYRLEKVLPEAEVSPPVKPIVFYISHEVPDKWRSYIKKGVEAWQPLFEKAGFSKAIQAFDAPTAEENSDWDPEDVRYSVIRWTPSGRQNAMGPAVVDPRSGEVISSHAIFWHNVLKLTETWYFTQVSPLDARARKLPLPDDLMGELLSYVVAHEVGHALGLRHNFKAHSAYSVAQLRDPEWTKKWGTSASIMDYARFNYVAQPGDDAGLIPKFGPYDYFAIDWGYRDFGDELTCDGEWPLLDDMAARQVKDPMLRFGGEDYIATLDPTVNENVIGGDPIEAAELGLRNIDRVVPYLLSATSSLGSDYTKLAEQYHALINQRFRELGAVSKIVGGVEEVRALAGRGDAPYTPASAERQKAAVKFLIDRGFSVPRKLLDPAVNQRIFAQGHADPLQGSNVQLLSRLLRPAVIQRMAEAKQTNGGKGYSGIDMLKDLNNGLFQELDSKKPMVELFRRDLQRNYVTLLLVSVGNVSDPSSESDGIERDIEHRSLDSEIRRSRMLSRNVTSALAEVAQQYRQAKGRPSEYRAALRSGLTHLRGKLEKAIERTTDVDTLSHLRDLSIELNNAP